MKKILSIGEVLWDMLPGGKCRGGAPLNLAAWAHRCGCEVALVSAVGNDELGRELVDDIAGLGVNLSALQTNCHPTGTVGVELGANGEPEYTIHEGVAWDYIKASPEAYKLAAEADAVCWGSLVQRTEECREAVLRLVDACPETAVRVFDMNLRQNFHTKQTIEESLKRADILKLNENEMVVMSEMFGTPTADEIIDKFDLKYVIFTCGAKQSEVFGHGIHSLLPTPKVEVVSTVGAGDSFTAVFLTDYLNGHDIPHAHRHAAEISAEVCTHPGAIY